jgi:hypothetical protein
MLSLRLYISYAKKPRKQIRITKNRRSHLKNVGFANGTPSRIPMLAETPDASVRLLHKRIHIRPL